MTVTTLEMLKKVKEDMYKEIELPDFPNGTPLVVQVKPVDLMKLASMGKLPNALMKSATEVFQTKGDVQKVEEMILNDEKTMLETMSFIDVIAEATLVAPTPKDFKKVGIEMTWEQKIALLSHAMGGNETLSTFREEQERIKGDKSSN